MTREIQDNTKTPPYTAFSLIYILTIAYTKGCPAILKEKDKKEIRENVQILTWFFFLIELT